MAQIFKAKKSNKAQVKRAEITIEKLDHQGLGCGRLDGKIVFVPGALPQERVLVNLIEQKKQYAKAELIRLISPSEKRIQPDCPHYQSCGGCNMQTLAAPDQIAYKQDALLGLMTRFTGTDIPQMVPAIQSEPWQYRRTARLSVAFDRKRKQVVMGFRQKNSKALVEITQCPVLCGDLETLIQPLRALLDRLSIRRHVGHIELFATDSGLICLFRILKDLSAKDSALLAAFETQHQLSVYLQRESDSIAPLNVPEQQEQSIAPFYQLAGSDIKLAFTPGDFIQVNARVNDSMVAQAINWLDLDANDRVLDLFCGIGNFTLPMALRCKSVVGIEGIDVMVEQGRRNARLNQIVNAEFYQADLFSDFTSQEWSKQSFDKVLLDPARAGAAETVAYLHKLKPNKIVYVSCNPATLARDSKLLIAKNYKLTRLGILDMFPQTGHVESMALFERI